MRLFPALLLTAALPISLPLSATPPPGAHPAAPTSKDAPPFVQIPPNAQMSFLDNGTVRVGVDLAHGGALVFLSRAGGGNLINNFDLGRQVQLAFYSGPVPFLFQGQSPAKHWTHLGWNPIQTGDDFRNPSKVTHHENNGKRLQVRCIPMQWPLNNVPGDCTFESHIELEGPVVKVRAVLHNARTDPTQYPARLQELPAVYSNAAFPRVISYTGPLPFTGADVSEIPRSRTAHPWSLWRGTEGWSALLDAQDQGLGLITPGRTFFTGGFAGKPGPNDPMGNSTGYLAGQGEEILDHHIVYEFRYELLPGSLSEIRERARTHRPQALPAWTFETTRSGWHYRNASDSGWPVQGQLEVDLSQNDPQLLSPFTHWHAAEAPYLLLEAAFHTRQRTATLSWQPNPEDPDAKKGQLDFPVQADGEFHSYCLDLSASPNYRGALERLRFDPVAAAEAGAWMKLRSIRFSKAP
ncbi:MAG: hypothetical protein RLZZ244_990 [Verrucomicrobiota bacterium]|jgi:hypothetical protein